MNNSLQEVRYDTGWILLIKKAKNNGLTREEVRLILNELKSKSMKHTS